MCGGILLAGLRLVWVDITCWTMFSVGDITCWTTFSVGDITCWTTFSVGGITCWTMFSVWGFSVGGYYLLDYV